MEDLLKLLQNYLLPLGDGGICVAFSSGADSSVLLKTATGVFDRVLAVTVATPLHHIKESEQAALFAESLGVAHAVLEIDELPELIMSNPPDRCYHCKINMFGQIIAYAREQGYSHVLDGTNADDLKEYRPGLKAIKELGVLSPLAELGIAKQDARDIGRQLGVQSAQKPSSPCMATRFPYGDPLDLNKISHISRIETYIKALGIPIVRARVHNNLLRIEVEQEMLEKLFSYRSEITALALREGFDYVTLDLEGFRSGSMDIPLRKKAKV